MPKKREPHTPGDRDRLEEFLPAEVKAALDLMCGYLGVPVSAWHRVPAIARTFETIAVRRFIELAVKTGAARTKEEAINVADEQGFGVNPLTAMQRASQWRAEAQGRTRSHRRRGDGFSI